MKPRQVNCIIVSILSALLISCGGVIKSYISKDTENVPPDFGKEPTTLLVLGRDKSYNFDVRYLLRKYYTGAYVLIPADSLQLGPYEDNIKYRFVLGDNVDYYSAGTTRKPSGVPGGRTRVSSGPAVGSRSYSILDRKTAKVHDTGVSSGASWKTVLIEYLKKMDTERKKNGGN